MENEDEEGTRENSKNELDMGVSLMVVSQNSPKWSFVGKPMVVGYHHFRKPPYEQIMIDLM